MNNVVKKLLLLLLLIFIDFGLIYCFIFSDPPDVSASIVLFYLYIPGVFIINIIIAAVLAICKKGEYAGIWIINGIIAAFIMYYIFSWAVNTREVNDNNKEGILHINENKH